jgi:hypothetical protein
MEFAAKPFSILQKLRNSRKDGSDAAPSPGLEAILPVLRIVPMIQYPQKCLKHI